MYSIPSFSGSFDFDSIEPFFIDQYVWSKSYCPKAEAKLCHVQGQGFALQMTCYEASPLTRYKKHDEPVYTDSCMECFINFSPNKSSIYLNFEMNSNGTLLCQKGTRRGGRAFIRSLGIEPPKPKATVENDFWRVELFISLSLIEQIYGESTFSKGDTIKANFYKCGEDTLIAHFGSWSKIDAPEPDFHLPQFFAELTIG